MSKAMIYEMGSKSQKRGEGGETEGGGRRSSGKKETELFQVRDEDRIIKQSYSAPTEREAIRGAHCRSGGISQNNISQCPTGIDDVDPPR